MTRKWGRVLSVLLLLAALSTAVVAWAGNAQPVRAGTDDASCADDGPGVEPTQDKGCRDACQRDYEKCLQAAKVDYEKLLEDCRGMPDPVQRAACFKASAEAYQEMIKACKAAFEACLEACGRGR